jgi:hypothetical protein
MHMNYEGSRPFRTLRGVRVRQRGGSAPRTTPEQRTRIRSWVWGRLPTDWFGEPARVDVDDEEILIVGSLPEVALPVGSDAERATAEAVRISGFREETRDKRMAIAEEATQRFGRHVSWGATCGETTLLFTTASVPVMTRLRLSERLVLDTLIDAGVARSRSEALGWCVRLVAQNEDAWIADLRAAFEHVEEVRSRGPSGGQSAEAEDAPDD